MPSMTLRYLHYTIQSSMQFGRGRESRKDWREKTDLETEDVERL